MGYAEALKGMMDEDIRPAPVLPTGHYKLKVVTAGNIVDNNSDNEKAPAAYIRFTVTAEGSLDADPDDIKDAMKAAGYTSEEDFFSNWKSAIDFEVWPPRDGQTEEQLLRNLSAKIRRVLGISELRADASLAEVLAAPADGEFFVIGLVEAVDSDSGPRNYRIGSRALSPVDD